MNTVIWDYNGTILDDVDLSVEVENQMLRERDLHAGYTTADYQSLFSFPLIDYYRRIGYTFEHETFEEVADEFSRLYDEKFNECGLCEGFLDKIHESREKGYHNVILSACEHNKLLDQCRQLGIDHLFDEIMGIDSFYSGSKVEMARKWMHNTDVEADDCLYLGDTGHDAETAHAIGVEHIILVAQGHQSYEALKKENGIAVHSLKEVELI